MTGFICIDKPEGITSFTAVNKLRRICGIKKAGHTGTLDPMATGVLPIMIGGATRFSEFIPTHDKAYEADILLGTATDSYDITGAVISQKDVNISYDEFKSVLDTFIGEIQQYPPMYSAVSKDGVRLYKLARQGITVEREARTVTIKSAEIIAQPQQNVFTVSVSCSAGTYIRSLASDIGEKLGCGACLSRLRRTFANGFSLDDCVTFEQLQKIAENGKLESKIKATDSVLDVYPKVKVTEAQSKRFSNGGGLFTQRIRGFNGNGIYRVYSNENEFLGLGKAEESSETLEIARLLIK
ncbi:MAG: tRNA pseudouridine(55) synthase TruB [Clostridia bacterium]|nr:tRNA pseudouridine(55) synthase TruB [Clostridia bacterium]